MINLFKMHKKSIALGLAMACVTSIGWIEAYEPKYPVHTRLYNSSGTLTAGEHINSKTTTTYSTTDLANGGQVTAVTTSPDANGTYSTTYSYPNGGGVIVTYSSTGTTVQPTPSTTNPYYYTSRPNLEVDGTPIVSVTPNANGTTTLTGVFGASTQVTQTSPSTGTTDYTGSYGRTVTASTDPQTGVVTLIGPDGVEMGAYTPGLGYASAGSSKTLPPLSPRSMPPAQRFLNSGNTTSYQVKTITLNNGQTITETITPSTITYTFPDGKQFVESYSVYGASSIENVPTTYTARPNIQYQGVPLISVSKNGDGTATLSGAFGGSTQVTQTSPSSGTTDYTGSYGHTVTASTDPQTGAITLTGPMGVEMGTYIPGVSYTQSTTRGITVTQNEPYIKEPTSVQTLNTGTNLFSASYNSYGEPVEMSGIRGLDVQVSYPTPSDGWAANYQVYNNGVYEGTYARTRPGYLIITGPEGGYVERGNGQIIWQGAGYSN